MASHVKHVEQVLTCLRQAYLRLKPSKCHFTQKEVKVLGYIVNSTGISPDPEKIVVLKS